MTDVFSPAKRSKVMAQIRGRGNAATELALIKMFRAMGVTGWRRSQPVFGSPDFVFRGVRLAVFVDGCFWHGCVTHCKYPASHRAFWRQKLDANVARDRLVSRVLRENGWRVLRIWEHELHSKNSARLAKRIRRAVMPVD